VSGRHVGILTGGGDVPGLNVAIKAVYEAAKERGWTRADGSGNVTGILRGWKGTLFLSGAEGRALQPDPWLVPLTDEYVRRIDRTGGTILHSSRTRPDRIKPKDLPGPMQARAATLPASKDKPDHVDATDAVIANLQAAGIDCLVAIGGDDTLGYGHTLSARGFPVVGIPKTMDNDVRGTEYAIGFSTCLARAVDFINRQRTHLGSHETVGVFRIFGRNAGFTSLGTAMAVSDVRCQIPEHRFDLDALCARVQEDYARNPRNYALVLCSEGAIWEGAVIEEYGEADAFGHRKKVNVAETLAAEIKRRTGLPTRMQDITYDLRSGEPDAFDKIVASSFGALAVQMIASGRTDRMVCLAGGVYADAPLPDAKLGARTVDVDLFYDPTTFRPKRTAHAGRPVFF
jgi:6-phosphofructokinase 1